MKTKGFTLLELLIVISIIAVLAVVGFSNYFNSLKSARDARRKADLQTIQKALELYYQDNENYPPSDNENLMLDNGALCHPNGCDIQTYLQSTPTDPSGDNYKYITQDQTSYQMYACIENTNDQGPGVKQEGYGYSCGQNACADCKYGVSSTNTAP